MARKTPQEKGENFEKLIEHLLKQTGKHGVKRNVHIIKKTRKNGKIRFQIDIVYGLIFKNYVECKYHSNSLVSLSEVSKFYSVLEMLNQKRGEMYTNTDYVPRAREYARKHNIKLYDYDSIKKLYLKTQPFFKRHFVKDINIEKLL